MNLKVKTKQKTCDGCGELRYIWKNESLDGERMRYCKGCWSTRVSKKPKPIKRNKTIRSRSPKRAKQEREYSKEAKAYKELHPFCQATLPNICTNHTSDVHHKAGRIGALLLNQKYWMPVCRPCHNWIEEHAKKARALGFRLSKTDDYE